MEKYVEKLVAKGRYISKSEVIREGIRLVQEREAKLAALAAELEKGLADIREGRTYTSEEVFEELQTHLRLLQAAAWPQQRKALRLCRV